MEKFTKEVAANEIFDSLASAYTADDMENFVDTWELLPGDYEYLESVGLYDKNDRSDKSEREIEKMVRELWRAYLAAQ